MAVNAGSAEARELGAALKKLRNDRGVSMEALGERIGVTSANFTFWERGERVPREEHLLNILDELEPDDAERDRLLGLYRKAGGPGQLVAGQTTIGSQLAKLIDYEQTAIRLTDVAPLVFPGLLQTEDYARATFDDLSDIATRVALRIGRQKVITRLKRPTEFIAYIDSEVLVRPIAPPDVMVDQLRHLLEMQQRDNVTIRIVPSTSVRYNPMLAGPFMMLEFPTAAPIVHLEHYRASAFLWERADVDAFSVAVEKISGRAMTPAASAEAIASILNGMETT